MEDHGVPDEYIESSVSANIPSHGFELGCKVEVMDGDRAYPALVTSLVNTEIVNVKYYEFEGDHHQTYVSRLREMADGPYCKKSPIVGAAVRCKYAEDGNYYNAVVTEITAFGCLVCYLDYGDIQEVPLNYLLPRTDDSVVETSNATSSSPSLIMGEQNRISDGEDIPPSTDLVKSSLQTVFPIQRVGSRDSNLASDSNIDKSDTSSPIIFRSDEANDNERLRLADGDDIPAATDPVKSTLYLVGSPASERHTREAREDLNDEFLAVLPREDSSLQLEIPTISARDASLDEASVMKENDQTANASRKKHVSFFAAVSGSSKDYDETLVGVSGEYFDGSLSPAAVRVRSTSSASRVSGSHRNSSDSNDAGEGLGVSYVVANDELVPHHLRNDDKNPISKGSNKNGDTPVDIELTPRQRQKNSPSAAVERQVEVESDDKHSDLQKKESTLHILKRTFTFKRKKGKFRKWTRQEMILLLVSLGVQIRSEDTVPTILLQDECEKRFKHQKVPPKPVPLQGEELVKLIDAVRVLQNRWFYKKNLQIMRDYHMELTDYELSRMQQAYGDEEDDLDLDDEVIEIGDIDAIIDQMAMESEHEGGHAASASSVGHADSNHIVADDSLDYMPSFDPDNFSPEQVVVMSSRKKPIAKEVSMKKIMPKMLDVLDTEWKAPDIEKALKSLDHWHPRKGAKHDERILYDMHDTTTGRHCCLDGFGEQCDLWGEGMLSEFIPYGVGITNYFKFLKWLSWVFVVAALISLPELVLNINGSFGTSNSQTTTTDISSSSSSTSSSDNGLISLASTTVGNLANTIQNGTITIALPGCSHQLFGEASCQLHRDSVGTFYTSVDMAIAIFMVIAFVWLAYFERREEKEQLKKTYYASMFTVQVTNLPKEFEEKELRDYFDKLLEGNYRIHGIQLAYECEKEIENCKKRGKLLTSRNILVQQHKCDCTLIRKNSSNPKTAEDKVKKKRLEFLRKLRNLDLDIKRFDAAVKQLAESQGRPLAAFVTFEERIGAMVAIDKHTTTFTSCLRKSTLFKNKKLAVTEAPEAAKIKWENLGYGVWQRAGRRVLTIILAMLLVLVSVAITFSAKALQQSSVISGGSSLCPDSFSSLSESDQIAQVEAHHEYLHCYCDQFSYDDQARISLCKHYLQSKLKAQVLTFFSSVVVLMVSTLIDMAIRMFADYEKHHTEDSKEKSIFLRVFFLQYLNTSCVFLINSNNWILEKVFGITSTATVEFSSDWYNSIGVTIILVQLGNILSTQSSTIYQFVSYHFKVKRAMNSSVPALTQSELNRAMIGPEFELSTRYAQTLSTFFVCLTFSSGIPLLYFIAAANYVVCYWVDKYVFIRLCKEPKPYNAHMGKEATMLIPLGIACHLAMSVWMLSNKEIFSSDVNDQVSAIASNNKIIQDFLVKITFKQTVPLFALLCVILGVYFLYHVLKRVRGLVELVQLFCMGNMEVRDRIQVLQFIRDEGVVETFSGLVYAGKMKGLSTYNILQNPDYKEAFGITWNFAFKHQHLRSLYNFKANELAKAISIDDELEDSLDDAMLKQQRILKRKAKQAADHTHRLSIDGRRGLRNSTSPTKFNRMTLKRVGSEFMRQALVFKDEKDVIEAPDNELHDFDDGDEDAEDEDATMVDASDKV